VKGPPLTHHFHHFLQHGARYKRDRTAHTVALAGCLATTTMQFPFTMELHIIRKLRKTTLCDTIIRKILTCVNAMYEPAIIRKRRR
jgi:hypothetical protein